MGRNKLLLTIFVSLCLGYVSAVSSAGNTYLQAKFDHQFANTAGAVIIVDVHTGEVLASVHQDQFDHSYPPGSLIKPFSVISYYTDHTTFPVFECPPTSENDPNGCWDRNGHGHVDITRAIAYSCNVYFRQLAPQISLESFQNTLRKFGLAKDNDIAALPEVTQRKLMVGMTNDWTVSPLTLLHAYCSIYTQNSLPRPLISILKQGMLQGGQQGTSLEARRIAGVPLLGKTGTTLHWLDGETSWKQTQGWWIGVYPADEPQIAILAFASIGRGATDAAPLGGKALAAYLRISHRAGK